MNIMTLPGVVENGQIRLTDNVSLPEKTPVYVVIPSMQTPIPGRLTSPRLVHPEQTADFQKVVEELSDADV